jgi:hypothetical protein
METAAERKTRGCTPCTVCETMDCIWLGGWGAPNDRPDLSGIRLDKMEYSEKFNGSIVTVTPTTEDGARSKQGHYLIGRLLQEEGVEAVIEVQADGRQVLIGHDAIKRRADMVLKRRERRKRRRVRTKIIRG